MNELSHVRFQSALAYLERPIHKGIWSARDFPSIVYHHNDLMAYFILEQNFVSTEKNRGSARMGLAGLAVKDAVIFGT